MAIRTGRYTESGSKPAAGTADEGAGAYARSGARNNIYAAAGSQCCADTGGDKNAGACTDIGNKAGACRDGSCNAGSYGNTCSGVYRTAGL